MLGRTHSRLVTWTDFQGSTLNGDLATGWEQPDPTHWTFHLNPAARWQNRIPVSGRAVTAQDIIQHITRMQSLAHDNALPLGQRATEYAAIRRVTSPDSATVVIEMAKPNPFLLDLLAGRFALVQAPEAVDIFATSWQDARPEQVIGSGPFIFESNDGGVLSFAAHTAGHNAPLLDHLEIRQPGGEVKLFETNELDEVLTRDRRDAASLRAESTAATEFSRFEDSPVISTFFVGAPPWNNPGLLQAISAALNRSHLSDLLFGGRADACGPISPATPAFALNGNDMAKFPGYRLDADADAADARARWSAAGGAALGPIVIDVPSIFDPLYTVGAQVTGRLNDILGSQFRWSVETYTTISKKTAAGAYGNGTAAFWFGWGPPLSGPDPSLSFIDAFDSRAAGARQFGIRSTGLDARFDALANEFSLPARATRARDLSGALLTDGSIGVVSWLLQRSELFRRKNLHGSSPTPFWDQHLDALRSFA